MFYRPDWEACASLAADVVRSASLGSACRGRNCALGAAQPDTTGTMFYALTGALQCYHRCIAMLPDRLCDDHVFYRKSSDLTPILTMLVKTSLPLVRIQHLCGVGWHSVKSTFLVAQDLSDNTCHLCSLRAECLLHTLCSGCIPEGLCPPARVLCTHCF